MKKYHFVGTCVNSFDSDGECVVPQLTYRDTSHFAVAEENAKAVSKTDFETYCVVPESLNRIKNNKTTKFLHDEDYDVIMMYDAQKDVHYFFC